MNNLEKLTEATILALQGKLIEKENPKNRVINAKIRQGDKYIDKLSRTNDSSFKNDNEIITKSNKLDNIEKEIRDNSTNDGSFDINKARQNYKDRTGRKTV